jgi:hypothetical protein
LRGIEPSVLHDHFNVAFDLESKGRSNRNRLPAPILERTDPDMIGTAG